MGKSIIIGIVAVIVLGGGGYLIFHKSPAKTTTSSSNSSTSNTSSSTNTGGIIETKTTSGVGQYLADGSGRALYTYSGDKTGVSNCSGACIANWPPYVVTTSNASLPANVTTIKRSDDGSSQYAYKGMPLYYFSSDSSGQVTGDGVSGFSVAKP